MFSSTRDSLRVFLAILTVLLLRVSLVDAQGNPPYEDVTIATALSTVNIRPDASAQNAAIGSLTAGSTVTILEEIPDGQSVNGVSLWYRIQLPDGTEGFVWSGALSTPTVERRCLSDIFPGPGVVWTVDREPSSMLRYDSESQALRSGPSSDNLVLWTTLVTIDELSSELGLSGQLPIEALVDPGTCQSIGAIVTDRNYRYVAVREAPDSEGIRFVMEHHTSNMRQARDEEITRMNEAWTAEMAASTEASTPTEIDASPNGVLYQDGYNPDWLLVDQRDLSDPATIVPVLEKAQIEEMLGTTLGGVSIDSISPNGRIMYLYVYGPNAQTPYASYLAAVDLSFLTRIPEASRPWGLADQQLWSPDSSALMGPHDMGVAILRRANSVTSFHYVQGNMLAWSRDGAGVWVTDGNYRLAVANLEDGNRQPVRVSFLEELNRPYTYGTNQEEKIIGLSFSPVSDDTLLLTGAGIDTQIVGLLDRFTIYRTTSDFAEPSVLSIFNAPVLPLFGSPCNNYQFRAWSPNGQYAQLYSDRCDSLIIDVENGTIPFGHDFFFSEDGTLLRYPCGWSPDNYLVTIPYMKYSQDDRILSFWEPTQPDQPALEVSGYWGGCPVWLPEPAP